MGARQIDLPWPATFGPWQELETGARHVVSIRKEVIPIIFVPGIMGTRLRRADKKGTLWDPDSKIFMLKNYGGFWVDAKERQRFLLGRKETFQDGFAVAYGDDRAHNKKVDDEFPGASSRGWGEVFWESYKPILRALHDARWARYLTRCFDLPVYACGYDWRASAEAGGKRLAEKVHEIRKTYGDACKQVILVTHSMGGLVARSACKLSGLAPHVLGIVHVVQPATGAPAAYWRLKAGFERKGFIDPVAYTLGTDGREVTSMLANMPGGLQLLPNREHRTNEGSPAWLKLISEDGKVTALPQKGDPYEEIYREEKGEWRLIRWKEYIAGHKPGAAGPEEASRAWSRFRGHLKNAERFHAALGDYRHPLTHHIYGTKNATVETVTLKIDKRLRRSKVPFGTGGMGRSWKTFADESDERGTFKVFFGPETDRDHFTQQSCMQMGPPEGDGDSTVPRYSATYLARADGQGGRFVFGKYDFEQTGTPVERAGHDTVFQESPKAVVTVIRCVTGLLLYRIRQTGAG